MARRLFVTGTDTHVGKTVVSAALVAQLRHQGAVRYWKPVQTGATTDDDCRTVRELAGCANHEVLETGLRFASPVSPHLAAAREGRTIDVAAVVRCAEAQTHAETWIIEGAGGVLVPLTPQHLMVDLMRALEGTVVLVARTSLGTINHTLLSLEVLRARGLRVAGVIMVGDRNDDNVEAVRHFGAVSVLGTLPLLKPLTPQALEAASASWDLSGVAAADAHPHA